MAKACPHPGGMADRRVLVTDPTGSSAPTRRRKLTALAVAAFSGLTLGLAGCGGGEEPGGEAAAITDAQRQLYDRAVEAGGRVQLFIGTGANEETDQLIERFNDTFPDVTVEYVSGTGTEVSERLLTEKRSGLNNADALIAPGISTFQPVADEGYLADFVPEDAGLFTYDQGTYIENRVYSFGGQYNGVCYNPNNVSEQEAASLRSYAGWVDPVWKGRAAVINADGSVYRRGLSYWLYQDDQLGERWLADLAALDPTVYTSGNVIVPQVIAGEFDVVYNISTIYGARAYREGAPLECVTGERAPYSTFLAGLVSGAPNEAGGQLFVNWLFSEAGQLAVQDTWSFNALREGFDTPVVDAPWWQTPEDPRVVDEQLLNQRYDELVTTFNNLFGNAQD